jgi:hypothetical protein
MGFGRGRHEHAHVGKAARDGARKVVGREYGGDNAEFFRFGRGARGGGARTAPRQGQKEKNEQQGNDSLHFKTVPP